MKIKCDFVTNSSSVSFCGWGTTVDGFDSLPKKIKEKIYNDYIDYTKTEYPGDEIVSYKEFENSPNKYDWDVHFRDLLEGTHFNVGVDSRYDYDYRMYIGISPTNENVQDMTINQIKELSEKELREVGFEDGVSFIEVGWYDG